MHIAHVLLSCLVRRVGARVILLGELAPAVITRVHVPPRMCVSNVLFHGKTRRLGGSVVLLRKLSTAVIACVDVPLRVGVALVLFLGFVGGKRA